MADPQLTALAIWRPSLQSQAQADGTTLSIDGLFLPLLAIVTGAMELVAKDSGHLPPTVTWSQEITLPSQAAAVPHPVAPRHPQWSIFLRDPAVCPQQHGDHPPH